MIFIPPEVTMNIFFCSMCEYCRVMMRKIGNHKFNTAALALQGQLAAVFGRRYDQGGVMISTARRPYNPQMRKLRIKARGGATVVRAVFTTL